MFGMVSFLVEPLQPWIDLVTTTLSEKHSDTEGEEKRKNGYSEIRLWTVT